MAQREKNLHAMQETQVFFFFNFTILYWFYHISTWIRHRYTRVPHPEPSSLLPPHTIPLGLWLQGLEYPLEKGMATYSSILA